MAISRQKYQFNSPGVYYLDLWRNMSIQERKLCRQMQVATVRGGLISDGDDSTTIHFNVAPDNWMVRSSIRRGFKLWNKMNKQAMQGIEGSVRPRYHDFKVRLNKYMTNSTGAGANVVTPVDAMGVAIPEGEWEYSRYHSEDVQWNNADLTQGPNRDADTFKPIIVGKHVEGTSTGSSPNGDVWEKISLTQSWIDTRATSIDFDGSPTIDSAEMSGDPLANLFDEADAMDEVLEDLDLFNDQPPYHEHLFFGNAFDFPSLPPGWAGSQFVESQNLQTAALAATQPGAGSISAVNSFSAICGLVQVEIEHGSDGNNKVELYLDVDMRGAKI